jgi:acetyl/propionyl-CoA carboxylase alpha subunit
MLDARNAFVIRGIDSNIPFQAALMQNPRFLSGVFTTAFLAEEYPDGFVASDVVHDDPGLLAAVGAFGRRRYIDRAVQVSGQMAGHQRKVGSEWVVQMEGKDYPVVVTAGVSWQIKMVDRKLGSGWRENLCQAKNTCHCRHFDFIRRSTDKAFPSDFGGQRERARSKSAVLRWSMNRLAGSRDCPLRQVTTTLARSCFFCSTSTAQRP